MATHTREAGGRSVGEQERHSQCYAAGAQDTAVHLNVTEHPHSGPPHHS